MTTAFARNPNLTTLDNPHPSARYAPVTFHDPCDAVRDGLAEYYGDDPTTYARGCARFEAALATCADEFARHELCAAWIMSFVDDALSGGVR